MFLVGSKNMRENKIEKIAIFVKHYYKNWSPDSFYSSAIHCV